MYFLVLDFDYGIYNYQLYTFLNSSLPDTCNFLSIGCDVIHDGGEFGIEMVYPTGYSISGDTLFRDIGTFSLPANFSIIVPIRECVCVCACVCVFVCESVSSCVCVCVSLSVWP